MIDRLLIFDLKGKMACWKKFYSNSSSMTYEIPTRTNLLGILASILELPRDSYYLAFNSENCKISTAIKSQFKKKFHCLNYFQKPNVRNYTQVRLETLMPTKIQSKEIRYRVYVWIRDEELFKKLIERVKNKNQGFGVYLGQRQFRGDIEFIDYIDNSNEKKLEYIENATSLNTLTNANNVNKENLFTENKESIGNEKMPIDFEYIGPEKEYIKNNNNLNRELQNVGDIVFSRETSKPLKTNGNFYKCLRISYQNIEENIAFYENDF